MNAVGNEGDFYKRPLPSSPGNPLRYSTQPVGVNKLRTFMKEIAKKGGLNGNYTNHSGKRTCATQLYNAGIQEQEIMARTGHRSEVAVRKYKRTSEGIQKAVSCVLDPNTPPAPKLCKTESPMSKQQQECTSKMPQTGDDRTQSLLSEITNKSGVVNFSGCTFNFA
ncbi:MAG: tyrosine-type recombinase/integrase [Candidatus Thiodiazotropha endolucinida]|nr:tyrosine-type recombinase/integrase [Candidatus Thiodiazotropha endolucinida]